MKILKTFSREVEKAILKFILEAQKTPQTANILSKKNNPRGITTPDFKLYY